MNELAPIKFGQKTSIGSSALRKEDDRFVTGQGHYSGDHTPEGALSGYMVRSSHAHARFLIGGLKEARALSGVHLILTHEDIADLGSMPCMIPLGENSEGTAYREPPRPALSDGIVRYVGDPIAFICADNKQIAADAAALLDIKYEPLEAVVGSENALANGAPRVWPGFGKNNIAAEATVGDKAATKDAFEKAHHVIELKVVNNRLVCNYMESRVCVAEYDARVDLITMTLGTQGVHSIRDSLAKTILKMDTSKLRVITPDVGGGFGTKGFMYHEYPLCAVAARRLKRAVKWEGDRSDHFVADAHGRDNVSTARLALDKQGKFLALDVAILADMGAYLSQYSVIIPWFGASMATGLYDIPVLHAHVTSVFTNTTPTDAYRGAGRPEGAYLLERLVNHAALEIGMDANELRRLNFIKPEQFPYTTPSGRCYDVGEFDGHLTRAMEVADWDSFEARRLESETRGKLRGIGQASYVEACAFAGSEPAFIDLNDDGTVTLLIGTQSTGQGHQTAYAQFISAQLNLSLDQIHVRQGDTNELAKGGGTGGSRSIPIGGVSVDRAAVDLSKKIKEVASDKLEVSTGDLELTDGEVRVVGTDRSLSFADIATISDEALQGIGEIQQHEATYPNGTHICELEVDVETGCVEILGYTAIDDFGVTVNPLLLAGQVHGGIVQGIGQALHERTVYDESGQLLSASFMDYAMPRADDLPYLYFETRNVPSTTNALGIKGAGEAGSIGSCPSVMNALVDALYHGYGIKHIDMPALPQSIWAAIEAAK
ncbi:MAG: xanthine dehydrogenase family protein molybdopterin-binding subunit [Hyphomicrobiales bacterium]